MSFILRLQDDTGTQVDFIESTTYRLEDGGLKIPPPKNKYVESGPSFYTFGQKITDINYDNREITITFEVNGTTRDDVASAVVVINKMMERARARSRDGDYSKNIELMFQLDGQAKTSYFRVLDGTFDFPDKFMSAETVHWLGDNGYSVKGCELSLTCEPFAYGASVLKTWEDASGDIPVELYLNNINTTGWDQGGAEVDNRFDSDGQNFVMIRGTDVDGDILAASTVVIENTILAADGLGKVYMGRMTGIREFTLASQLLTAGTSMVVNEDISHLRLPLRFQFSDGDQVYATAKNVSTKTLTVARRPIKSVAINNAGSGYDVGDLLIVSGGDANALLVVEEVNGSGAIQSLAFIRPGSGYTSNTGVSLTGGSGSSATVNTTVGTASTHNADAIATLVSLNPVLEGENGAFGDLATNDTHQTIAYSEASSGNYEEIQFQDEGVKILARWTISPDVVASLSGNKIRIIGRASPAGAGGESAGDDWNPYVNFRLKLSYFDRSGQEIDIHYTEWKNSLQAGESFMDFGSVMMPPFGYFGQTNSPAVNLVLQAQIHPDYVLDVGLSPIIYYLNLDYMFMMPVTGGYRVLQTRSTAIRQGDKIVDDAWGNTVYAEQLSSYPSGVSLGKAGVVVPYMTPIWLDASKDQTIFFLTETVAGLTSSEGAINVRIFAVPAFMNIVYNG